MTLIGKILNCVPKEFMTTPFHVSCPNSTEISCQKVCEMMHCFRDKKSSEKHLSQPFGIRLVEGAKSLQSIVLA